MVWFDKALLLAFIASLYSHCSCKRYRFPRGHFRKMNSQINFHAFLSSFYWVSNSEFGHSISFWGIQVPLALFSLSYRHSFSWHTIFIQFRAKKYNRVVVKLAAHLPKMTENLFWEKIPFDGIRCKSLFVYPSAPEAHT